MTKVRADSYSRSSSRSSFETKTRSRFTARKGWYNLASRNPYFLLLYPANSRHSHASSISFSHDCLGRPLVFTSVVTARSKGEFQISPPFAPALSIFPPLQINDRSKNNTGGRPGHRKVGVDLQISLGGARSGRVVSWGNAAGHKKPCSTFKKSGTQNNNPPASSFQPWPVARGLKSGSSSERRFPGQEEGSDFRGILRSRNHCCALSLEVQLGGLRHWYSV